jgi:predicted integral membrane protein DUF2269
MGITTSERDTSNRGMPRQVRQALLTAHIMMSVGLLGDSAGFLALSVRAARMDDPGTVRELVQVLNMFSLVFGIPLSIGALLSGVALGLGTKWGVFRYPWVTAKLLLIVSVMLVGTFVIGPAEAIMLTAGGDATPRLIAAASYDVLALATATGLSVFKPGGPFRRGTAARSAA